MLKENTDFKKIERLYLDYQSRYQTLLTSDPAFAIEYQSSVAKELLLSCASFFEGAVISMLKKRLNKNNSSVLSAFIDVQLSRKYHTLFDWDKTNANKFYSNFDEKTQTALKEKHTNEESFKESVLSFLTIGSERNKLVHTNFISFSMIHTADEVFNKFTKACNFIDAIDDILAQNE